MIKPLDMPGGFIRNEDLLNILLGLTMTNCDLQTLAIVARTTGIGEHFNFYSKETLQPLQITNCFPLLLPDAKRESD